MVVAIPPPHHIFPTFFTSQASGSEFVSINGSLKPLRVEAEEAMRAEAES